MTHLITRTQLILLGPFIHRRPKPSLTKKIPCSQTVTLPQFSTKTSSKCRGVQSPAMDVQLSESSKVDSDRRPLALPEDLSRNVVVLSCESTAEGGVCDVYLVGTNHCSKESSRQVQAIVNYLKPEAVFLELCERRKSSILTTQDLKVDVPTMGEMIKMLKEDHMFEVFLCWYFAKKANELEVFPCYEFRVAYEEAIKYGGRVILGDRPEQITIKRAWSKMPLWYMTKLLFYPLFFKAGFSSCSVDLNKLEMNDNYNVPLAIQEMSKDFPTLMKALVDERDQYMSCGLLKVASESRSVVAVVGKGHLEGIKKNWKQPVMMKDLMTVPSPKRGISTTKVFTSVGVVVAGVAIISNILRS